LLILDCGLEIEDYRLELAISNVYLLPAHLFTYLLVNFRALFPEPGTFPGAGRSPRNAGTEIHNHQSEMSISAVIFDLGGVLVRTEDPAPRIRLAGRLGISPEKLGRLVFESESAIRAALGEISTLEHWEAVRQELNLSPAEIPIVEMEFWEGDRLDDALVDALRSLRPRVKTALLSNAWDNLRHMLEEHWKIADAFDEIIISAELGLVKPDPRVYELAYARLAVEPAEAVFVDDFPENVEGARAAGMQAIWFRSSEQVLEELGRMLEGGRRTPGAPSG
jgi:glucose-1-phosphatase